MSRCVTRLPTTAPGSRVRFSISALGSITYYVGHYLRPGVPDLGRIAGERRSLWLSTMAAVAVILVTPLVGALTDRIGRKPVLIGLVPRQRRPSRSRSSR